MLWSGAGLPLLPEHRARTTDDFPNLSSLIRPAGVLAASMADAVVTAEALDSIETSSTSFGSRKRKTSVSTICSLSRLKEYCTVEKVNPLGKSCRMRTNSATACCDEMCAVPFQAPITAPAAASGLAFGSSTERPRSTSKSGLNEGCMGMRLSVDEISSFSAGDGVQTFSTFTLTCGAFGPFGSCARHMQAVAASAATAKILLYTPAF